MTARKPRADVEGRLVAFRAGLRRHHARVEPDERFADRVAAQLPPSTAWSFEWAVRRVLPVSVALAVAMAVVVSAIGGSAGRTSRPASAAATTPAVSDPLEWLLEGGQEVR